MRRTIRIKIKNNALRETIDQYFEAYKFCIDTGFGLHTSSKRKVHNATYKEIRIRWPAIPSALVQTVRDVACEKGGTISSGVKPVDLNSMQTLTQVEISPILVNLG